MGLVLAVLRPGVEGVVDHHAVAQHLVVVGKVGREALAEGEETGRLDDLLIEAADILDRESQGTLDRLLSILVPSITIMMGAIVAALIASVLVGILSLNDLAF